MMVLIGSAGSPFVRRVAVSLRCLGLPFERRLLSPSRDGDELRKVNPLGRVPALVLDDGEVLVDSGAILDHLDELAGPDRALVPPRGAERRKVLRLVALLTGAAEKSVQVFYERNRRPPERIHPPWEAHCAAQVEAALTAVEAAAERPFLAGARLTQADVTAVATWDFVRQVLPDLADARRFPGLAALVERCAALPAFAEAA